MPRRNRAARRGGRFHHVKGSARQTGRTCPTGKVRYRDKAEAQAALQRLRSSSSRAKVQRRAFGCHLCRGWHLTAQPKSGDPTVPPPR